MNGAILWIFLFPAIIDNQVLIEPKENTCTHTSYQQSSYMKNKKCDVKSYQKAIYNPSHSKTIYKTKIIYG